MSNPKTLAEAFQGALETNGWDAVLALNEKQVNDLFFQQYLRQGPTNPLPGQRLRTLLNVGEGRTFWILDLVLGPPEWSFPPGSTNGALEMALIRGSVVSFDSGTRTINNVLKIQPNESKLTGSLELAKVKGEVSPLGTVVADLGASAYSPNISGLPPNSVVSTAIGDAVKAFFAHNETKFTIGSVAPGTVPALMPTDFHFTIQPKPNTSDACVTLLIKTTGPEGTIGPLPTYPIPDGSTASLWIAERAVFGGAFVTPLNAAFGKFGTAFSGSNDGGHWVTHSSGGSIPLGQINQRNQKYPDRVAWSSDAHSNESPVNISLNGFTLSGSNGQVVAAWHVKQPQTWSVYNCSVAMPNFPPVCGNIPFGTAIQVDYRQVFNVAMKSGSDSTVAFNSQSTTLTATPTDEPNGWDKFWAGAGLPSAVVTNIQAALTEVFKNFAVPEVNTFALTSLLFPSQHVVHMKKVSLPSGLSLSGNLDQPITISPPATTLAPGQTVQLKVDGIPAADIMWKPTRVGSISATGLYTAPASVRGAEVVVLTAISQSNASLTGSAMVLVRNTPGAGGLLLAPSLSVVTPGQQVQLSSTDPSGRPVSVDWTLAPNIGTIQAAFGSGLYSYVAPNSIANATDVVATAVNRTDHSKTGTAVIRVVPATTVTIAPNNPVVKFNETIDLTATVTSADADDLRWVIYPVGAGKIEANVDDPTKAKFTAPASGSAGGQVFVVAYLVDDSAAGLGVAVVDLPQQMSLD